MGSSSAHKPTHLGIDLLALGRHQQGATSKPAILVEGTAHFTGVANATGTEDGISVLVQRP